jgi:hypothetical protein
MCEKASENSEAFFSIFECKYLIFTFNIIVVYYKTSIMQKKIFGCLFLFLIGMLIFASCAKDTLVPAQSNINPNLKISFKDTIQPIFTSSCMGSSCHSGSVIPNLQAGQAYSSLTSGNYINTGSPSQSTIYTVMAPGGIMSNHCNATDADLILAWIQQGALNN